MRGRIVQEPGEIVERALLLQILAQEMTGGFHDILLMSPGSPDELILVQKQQGAQEMIEAQQCVTDVFVGVAHLQVTKHILKELQPFFYSGVGPGQDGHRR